MPEIKLTIVRHGPAKHNLGSENRHTFAGRVDNKLTDEGVAVAKKLATCIKKQGSCDLVLASKLKRSFQTAEIIAEICKVPIEVVPDLEEIDVGDFAGHTEEEVKRIFPNESTAFYDGDIKNWNFPNGEDFDSVKMRVERFIKYIKKNYGESQKIVVVGHGMINRVLFYELLPEREDLWKNRSYSHDRIVEIIIDN